MTTPGPARVLILGASARAAAFSAIRSGLAPIAVDLFADQDLIAVAPCVRVAVESYPDALFDVADALPDAPWIYTGSIENRPDLIERLSQRRPLLGNSADLVRAVRDPIALADALLAAGFRVPDVRLDSIGVPRDGSWLRKPLASGGGIGVERYMSRSDGQNATGFYYQQRIGGLSLSAVFIGNRRSAKLAGITQQLIGRPGEEFGYRGTVAPWPVSIRTVRRVEQLGAVIGGVFGLSGLFGVDFQLVDGVEPWVVEVNPRYTASVEVLELAFGRSLFEAHCKACRGQPTGLPDPVATRPLRYVAKQMLFAEKAGVFMGVEDPRSSNDRFQIPRVADIPAIGEIFQVGDPILTCFSRGKSPRNALRGLARFELNLLKQG